MTAVRPVVVDVLGQRFGIEWLPWEIRLYADPRRIGKDDRQLLGTTEISLRRIAIRDIGSVENERETLVHELLHAVLLLVGQDSDPDDKHMENVVQALAVCLLQVLRANVGLVSYLLEEPA